MIDVRFEGELHAKSTNKEILSVRRKGKRQIRVTRSQEPTLGDLR